MSGMLGFGLGPPVLFEVIVLFDLMVLPLSQQAHSLAAPNSLAGLNKVESGPIAQDSFEAGQLALARLAMLDFDQLLDFERGLDFAPHVALAAPKPARAYLRQRVSWTAPPRHSLRPQPI